MIPQSVPRKSRVAKTTINLIPSNRLLERLAGLWSEVVHLRIIHITTSLIISLDSRNASQR
ncbi:hypothetical protein E2C01_071293 [Portunus trituberculatus]|uniref:Uncharacterized protein n=1 Tax=Portunus trituberculatus TaxID=210409 RepID=A0A5B7I4S5_PORTR|nr:hypothetical protein [Portunus trituberculatus]